MSLYAPASVIADKFSKNLAGLTSYSFNFSEGFDATIHRLWRIELEDIMPETAQDLHLRFSGVSTANYNYLLQAIRHNTTDGVFKLTGQNQFQLSAFNIPANGAGYGGLLEVTPGTANHQPRAFIRAYYLDSSNNFTSLKTDGSTSSAGPITSIDFLFSGGTTFTRGMLYIEALRR